MYTLDNQSLPVIQLTDRRTQTVFNNRETVDYNRFALYQFSAHLDQDILCMMIQTNYFIIVFESKGLQENQLKQTIYSRIRVLASISRLTFCYQTTSFVRFIKLINTRATSHKYVFCSPLVPILKRFKSLPTDPISRPNYIVFSMPPE